MGPKLLKKETQTEKLPRKRKTKAELIQIESDSSDQETEKITRGSEKSFYLIVSF